MKLKLSPRDELILELLLVVLAAVLIVMLLVLPQYRQIGEIKVKQEQVRRQVQEAEATLARLKEAKAESIANRAELIKIANRVPDEPQLPTLIVAIQDVANQSGVEFISVTPEAVSEAGSFSIVPLRLSVTGQFRDLVDFLGRLYALQREVRVNSVTIAVQDYPTLSADLGAQTFVMGQPKPPANTPPAPPGTEGAGG